MALTQDQLTASMYFIVGIGTEGGDSSYRLSVAGLKANNLGTVSASSGYTLGAMQLDLGQRGLNAVGTNRIAGVGETAYVDAILTITRAYCATPEAIAKGLVFPSNTTALRAQLLTHGTGISLISDSNWAAINGALATPDNMKWVHNNVDLALVSENSGKALPLVQQYGTNWTEEQQLQAGQELAKVYNQSPKSFSNLKSALAASQITNGGVLSFSSFQKEIGVVQDKNTNIQATKAGDVSKNFYAASQAQGLGDWLSSATQKVMAADFDPRRLRTDADMVFASKVAHAGSMTITHDASGKTTLTIFKTGKNGVLTDKQGNPVKTVSYQFDASTDSVMLNQYKGNKLVSGTSYAHAGTGGAVPPDTVPPKEFSYLPTDFTSRLNDLESAAAAALQKIHADDVINGVGSLYKSVVDGYDQAAAKINSLIADAKNTWNKISSQGQQTTNAAGDSVLKFVYNTGNAVSDELNQSVQKLETFWDDLANKVDQALGKAGAQFLALANDLSSNLLPEDVQISDDLRQLDTGAIEAALDIAQTQAPSIPVGIPTPQNPTTFTLNTDPVNLKPAGSDVLGGTSGGQGLLGSGAGYDYSMPLQYVNTGGFVTVAPSNMTTGEVRIGNQSLSNFTQQLNALRQTWYNETQLPANHLPGQTTSSDASFSTPVNAPSGTGNVTLTVTSGNNVVNTLTGQYRYDNNGARIGFDTADGKSYIQFVKVTEKADGGITIHDWVTFDKETAATALVQKSNFTNPSITPYTDPLTLDAGNDGVRLSAAPVNFDLNADGVAEVLPWTAPTDPLLVMDVNGDGKINNGTELVDLTDSGKPLNLFRLDSNGDGVLNASDAAYWNLQLWQDRNQDGYASPEERQSLADTGIVSIDLNPAHLQTATVAGKANVKGVTATYTDGSTRILWDVPFDSGTAATATSTSYAIGINKVSGSGQTALVAMSALGVTLDLNGSGADQAIGGAGNDTLIGTGGDDWLIGGGGSNTYVGGTGSDLLVITADDQQANIDGGAGIDTVVVADDRGVMLNLAQAHVEVVYGGYGNDVFIGGGADNYFIDGAAGDDLIVGGSADDVLTGGDGNDVVDGGAGNDLIRGGRGDDQLFGGDGNDVIDGGLGNDTIQGGNGNDVILASGGEDFVDGGAGFDMINLHGQLEDYRFVKNADGSYLITDTKNNDGSTVAAGQVSDRDGIQHVTNVERFSFLRGVTPTSLYFDSVNPVLVNDQVTMQSAGAVRISADSLLANDIDFNSRALSIYWVGDAIGGTVSLINSQLQTPSVIFTPDAGYVGPLEFSYKVQDAQGNKGITLINVADPTITGEMKGRVSLISPMAPTDPDYAKQWYLGAVGVPQVWQDGITGKGVNVLVLDPAGQFAVAQQVANLNNPDLISNKAAGFVDTADHSAHATAVAGVIGAALNGIGGVGVAYEATLDSKSLYPNGASADLVVSVMTSMSKYDVVNNSWVVSDIGDTAPYEIGSQQAALNGRHGLGTVVIFSAGNNRAKGYDSGFYGLTSNSYTIDVAAVNRIGDIGAGVVTLNPFSERGTNILVAAPGSDITTAANLVVTANGSTIGGTSTTTQGTSFAAPIVSGIAALMLEANPNLSYRDVQTILALTARKDMGQGTQSATSWQNNADLGWNGTGMHFSNDFGFGMVDARAAVHMAESWVSETTAVSGNYWVNQKDVPQGNAQILSFHVTETVDVEQVMVNLGINSPDWGSLVVTLISPDGTHSVLLDHPGVMDNPYGLSLSPNLMSVQFRGENSVGTWKLMVEGQGVDKAINNLVSAGLNIIGADESVLKRYVLTDEYAGGWSVGNIPATPSELNASAVSGNIRIDLSGNTSSNVAGKALAVGAGIDRLIGGDGADTLIGAASNETILGGRGNDSIDGGDGNDWLEGGLGNDTLLGGNGSDTILGGAGNDVLVGGSGQDLLVAGEGADTLYGGSDADLFMVDGDHASRTTIKDFSAVAGGDILLLRTNSPLAWGDVTQTIQGTNLTISFGTSSVLLERVVCKLDANQLCLMNGDSQIAQNLNGMNLVVTTNVKKLNLGLSNASDVLNISENGAVVNGGDGNDHITVGASFGAMAGDTLIGGWGDDTLQAGMHDSVLYGDDLNDLASGNDRLIGGQGNDALYGGRGNDTLSGGAGIDTLNGGSSNDTYLFNLGDGMDSIVDSDGYDQIIFGGGILANNVKVSRTGGMVKLAVSNTDSISFAENAIEDMVFSDGAVWHSSDIVRMLNSAPTGGVTISGTASQNKKLTVTNNLADADGMGLVGYQWQVSGDKGVTWLDITGATLNNFTLIQSQVGKEVRVSASYVDKRGSMETVKSKATAVVGNVNDLPTGGVSISGTVTLNQTLCASNTLADADGLGVISYQWQVSSNGGKVWKDIVGATADTYRLTGAQLINNQLRVKAHYVDLYGKAESVVSKITAPVGTSFVGTTEADLLIGTNSSDRIDGLTGADTMIGGLGNDTYVVDNKNDQVIEKKNAGIDTVESSISLYLYDNLENITLTGTSAINGLGNVLNNVLIGNSGDNILDGGAGSDTMKGGAGNDTYVVDNAGDMVVENAGEGIDTVQSSVRYTLGSNVENLKLTGVGKGEYLNFTGKGIAGTGNELNNIILSNYGGNATLDGAGGNDILRGSSGKDYLVDTQGNNLLFGGPGNDFLLNGYNAITGCFSNQVFVGGTGADTIFVTGDYTTKNVICYNAGDGVDTVYLDGGKNTLSLGGGIKFSDLKFLKKGSDLILNLTKGPLISDGIIFKDWYTQSKSDVGDDRSTNLPNLQIIESANNYRTPEEDSRNPRLFDWTIPEIQQYSFTSIVNSFNTVVNKKWYNPIYDWQPSYYWQPSEQSSYSYYQLLTYGGKYDSKAYGGDIAFKYGKYKSLGDIFSFGDMSKLQGTLNDPLFGKTRQQVSQGLLCQQGYSDPLVLDLNGNGIETVGIDPNNPILFDHAGTGVKHATGWVAASDGFLVLDRNNNGTIDDGSELFSENVPLNAGGKAANGFAALAQEDTNNDGVINNLDANFSRLRVWQDTNQDGISQLDELKSLTDLNIVSINVSSVANDQLLPNGNRIADLGNFTYADGSQGVMGTGVMADVMLASDNSNSLLNSAPVATQVIADQLVGQNSLFSFHVPDGSFVDTNPGDTLSYSATLADGSELPSWLTFNAATQTFDGKPNNADIGALSLLVTATDSVGLSATSGFTLNVVYQNQAPVADSILNQAASENIPFVFTVPAGVFADPNSGDSLTYTAKLADGSNLPSWLTFDAATQTFSGTPGHADMGNLGLLVTATDTGGLSASSLFALDVANVSVLEKQVFSCAVPATMFDSANFANGTVLAYNVTQVNGAALPAWLTFDATTQTFNGTPGNEDVGNLGLLITATDGTISASNNFAINVVNVNDPPSAADDGVFVSQNDGAIVISADTLLNNDTDPDLIYGDTLNIIGVTQAASGATVSMVDGSVQYDMGNRYQSLNEGETATDTFSYTIADSAGLTSTAQVTMTITGVNDGPVSVIALTDQTVMQDAAFSYQLPVNAFTDVDVGDVLSYTATFADGTELPSWLIFDATTQTFSGTPGNADVGNLNLMVTATDTGGLTASSVFNLAVADVNDAPVVVNALVDQVATQDVSFAFVMPAETFSDADFIHGDTLTYTVALADGTDLPSWLNFDAATQTFSGTPGNADVGNLNLMVTATDTGGLSASSTFNLAVANINDAPMVANALEDQVATQDASFTFVMPTDSFSDADFIHGDTLSYAAALADGTALPSWLTFDATTQTFSGTPGNADVGNLNLVVTATDTGGLTISSAFNLNVDNVNDAPVSANLLESQNVVEGKPFAYTLPTNAFSDVDIVYGDAFTLSAKLSDGMDLPAWLTFDAATQTFSGIPGAGDLANLSVLVTAIDSGGLSASSNFTLVVNSQVLYGSSGNDNLTGTIYDDTLYGLAGNDTLTGGAGNDVLDGGAGADKMLGGLGDDTYVVDITDDVVTENAGEGTDTVQSSIAYTLGANVENLTLTGTAVIRGTGNVLDNILDGSQNTAANVLTGGAGNDTYILGAGDTVVEAVNAGIDTVMASATYTLGANLENLTLTGAETINGTGNTLDNVLIGNSADNILDGGVGADILSGGQGNDTYFVDNLGDVVIENAGEGIDTVNSSVTFTLGNNIENLTLTGVAAVGAMGNTQDNLLTGNASSNLLDGGAGVDTMTGGLGNDTYVVDSSGDVVIENANEGWDAVQSSISYALGANLENLTLTGTASINGTGNELGNALYGNSGDNILDGGAGIDYMAGGLGNDTYVVDTADDFDWDGNVLPGSGDVVVENANAGIDTVLSSIDYTLGANVENLTLTGSTATYAWGNELNNVIMGNSLNNVIDGRAGADTMSGGLGNDSYYVDNQGDQVIESQNQGIDTVYSSVSFTLGANIENLYLTGTASLSATGNELDNVLSSNSGIDVLTGGLGNDTYYVGNTNDIVVEYAGEGIDTVYSDVNYTLSANVENLILRGYSTSGTGNELNNVLTGNASNDTLNGGLGADTMSGGLGNDTYYVDNAGDVIIEGVGQGTDTVISEIDYSLLGTNLENLTLSGTLAVNAYGNEFDNILTGNSIANLITAGAGNDTLDGGAGADTMIGGLGNDTYMVDHAGDVVVENAGEGTDTVQSSLSYSLGTNLENLTLTGSMALNGTGNELDNLLVGNSAANTLTGGLGNDTLDGGAGADTLAGGSGNDTYLVDNVGDVIIEHAGEGTDTVMTSLLNYTLGANVENLTLTTYSTAANGTGNELNNVLTVTDGYTAALLASDAYLYGDMTDAYIMSYAQNDTLNGGAGADTMAAGLGDDTYIVDNAADVVIENAGYWEGTDTIYSSVSYVVSANVENMILTGSAAINGTGNDLGNMLTGNASDNILDGGAGADILFGGLGNDTYVVDNAGDVVFENAGEGTDTVQSWITYTLGANVENLTLTGTTAIKGTGNELDNVLDGSQNTAANVLTGGLGNDTYLLGTGDTIVEAANAGIDTVMTAATYTLGTNLDNLTLLGVAAINGTGNALDNVMTGNSAVNTLNGGAGNDLLTGGLGNDTLAGAAGNDILQGGADNDTLSDTAGSNLLDGGAGTDKLTGGTGNEIFIGGTGNDTITTGTGADLIAFNRGDGQDTVVASSGADNTLSLGGGIDYQSLALSKSGNNLILATGNGDQITMQNWFTSTANRSIADLQIVLDVNAYNANSADPLLNHQVQNFNFALLAQNFDQARLANPALSSWNMTDALLNAHLSGSDTTAMGGDLAYQYNLNGNLTGMGLAAAQTELGNASFGVSPQQLQPLSGLQTGAARLS
jgi:Ca2+-binding RTX toxin-like protein/chemotaxis regulatin CheY-phosphate phosphatase CheZ